MKIDQLRWYSGKLAGTVFERAGGGSDETLFPPGHLCDVLDTKVIDKLIERMLGNFEDGEFIH